MDLDDVLVGHWSSVPFSYGVMEASELGFLPDGQGWSVWFNFDSLCVTRLSWRCPEPGVVELHAKWVVEEASSEDDGFPAFGSTASVRQVDEVTRHHYTVGPAIPMPGEEAVPSVAFEEDVEFCHRFARGAKDIRIEEDPTHLVVPYESLS
ncbi:hypothetical protein FCH28_07870 [Streptomyces piniterrae]|uniref:Uncharacterized protein n=1 Tax=Streptomyces piniterrae TaxID=2571125 RepID=A0A4U0NS41_9ACTN|nr:hypothetical protein [Streptomyces piniterrae]TJZ57335.1 hypothetical protein FCH28_07870 [Streptomyces piniterrae]